MPEVRATPCKTVDQSQVETIVARIGSKDIDVSSRVAAQDCVLRGTVRIEFRRGMTDLPIVFSAHLFSRPMYRSGMTADRPTSCRPATFRWHACCVLYHQDPNFPTV